jgi:hypothetical protein
MVRGYRTVAAWGQSRRGRVGGDCVVGGRVGGDTASVSGAAPTTAPVTIPALQRQNLNTNMYKIYKIYKI